MSKLTIHPAALLFPSIEGEEFSQLVADIQMNGLMHPIALFDGAILDGRNRHRACEAAAIEPTFEDLTGKVDPFSYVVSANLHRRHLNAAQLADIAERLATMRHNEHAASQNRINGKFQPQTSVEVPSTSSIKSAAKSVGSSQSSVDRIRRIKKHAPELLDKTLSGEISLTAADQQAIAKSKANGMTKARRPKKPTAPTDITPQQLKDAQAALKEAYDLKLEAHVMKSDVEKAWRRLRDEERLISMPFSQTEFKLIRGLLHPDMHAVERHDRAQRAFDLFNKIERLCRRKEKADA